MTTRSKPEAGPRQEAHLRGILEFVGRNRLPVLGIPVLALAATAVFVNYVTPVYEAETSIRIDEQRSNVPVLDVLRTLSAGSEINTEMEVLRSRTLAEDVMDALALRLSVERPRRVPRSALLESARVEPRAAAGEVRLRRTGPDRFAVYRDDGAEPAGEAVVGRRAVLPGLELTLTAAAAEHEELVLRIASPERARRAFRRALGVQRPNREADIVAVRYEHSDPVLAREVPNTLAARFIARRNEIRRTESTSTLDFIRAQVDSLAVQLVGAEEMLRAFRETAQVVHPDADARAQVSRLAELQAQRDMVAAERDALARLVADVSAGPDAAPSDRRIVAFPSLLRNPASSEFLRMLAELENERAGLLGRRTEEDPDVRVVTERIRELEAELRAVASTYLEGLTNHVASLDATLARFGVELARIPAKEVEFARLQREAKVLEEIYTLLQTRMKEAEIAAAVEDPSVRVVDPAILPVRPIRPNVPLSVALALMLGLGLGVGFAFAREHLDTSVHTREDLQTATGGAPVLAMIPRIREAAANGGRRLPWRASAARRGHGRVAGLVAGRDPRSPVSEAYRSLRTNIAFSQPDRPPRTIVFTSPMPGEGKSTSAANLAITLAQQDRRCVLVDADMRRGGLHELLGAAREPGLSDVLLGRIPAEDAIRRIETAGGTIEFMPTGTLPPNPAELVGSRRMRDLLSRLEETYETILIDAPPLNVVTDAALLGSNADGVIVVGRAGATDRAALTFAFEQLAAVRAPVLGTVLNDVASTKEAYYGAYA